MRTSPTTFIRQPFATPRSTELLLAWSDAADDACAAYYAWCDADGPELDLAFAVYDAALDREEAAARALEAAVRGGRREGAIARG